MNKEESPVVLVEDVLEAGTSEGLELTVPERPRSLSLYSDLKREPVVAKVRRKRRNKSVSSLEKYDVAAAKRMRRDHSEFSCEPRPLHQSRSKKLCCVMKKDVLVVDLTEDATTDSSPGNISGARESSEQKREINKTDEEKIEVTPTVITKHPSVSVIVTNYEDDIDSCYSEGSGSVNTSSIDCEESMDADNKDIQLRMATRKRSTSSESGDEPYCKVHKEVSSVHFSTQLSVIDDQESEEETSSLVELLNLLTVADPKEGMVKDSPSRDNMFNLKQVVTWTRNNWDEDRKGATELEDKVIEKTGAPNSSRKVLYNFNNNADFGNDSDSSSDESTGGPRHVQPANFNRPDAQNAAAPRARLSRPRQRRLAVSDSDAEGVRGLDETSQAE